MSYVVKWGRERLHFPLPSSSTKLSFIRHQIAEYTQLPEDSFKLVHGGGVMKDDNAPSGESLPSGPPQPRAAYDKGKSKAPPEPRTEQSTLAQIHAERDGLRNGLSKEVDVFLATLPSDPQTNNLGAEEVKALAPTHARLSELLLQSLLRLDAVNAEGTWEEARKERKEAVREVQKVLDTLDGAWWAVKGRG